MLIKKKCSLPQDWCYEVSQLCVDMGQEDRLQSLRTEAGNVQEKDLEAFIFGWVEGDGQLWLHRQSR